MYRKWLSDDKRSVQGGRKIYKLAIIEDLLSGENQITSNSLTDKQCQYLADLGIAYYPSIKTLRQLITLEKLNLD